MSKAKNKGGSSGVRPDKIVIHEVANVKGEAAHIKAHLVGQSNKNVWRLCVCLPPAQSFNLPQMLMGQIAQNCCYTLARLIK